MSDNRLTTGCKRTIGIGHQGAVLLGEEKSRSHSVDTQPFTKLDSQLGSQVLSEIGNSSFGSSVTNHAGKRTKRRLGRNVDDTSFFLLNHHFGKYHGWHHGSEQVQIHHFAESIHLKIKNCTVRPDSSARHIASGGIYKHINTTVFGYDVF